MVICAIANCKNSKRNCEKDIVFHCFPKDIKLRKVWFFKCKRKDRKSVHPRPFDRICSTHFRAEDYKRDLQHELLQLPSRKGGFLKEDAIPSLNMPSLICSSSSGISNFKGSSWSNIKCIMENTDHTPKDGRIVDKCCIKNCPSVRRKGERISIPVKFIRFPCKNKTVAQSWLHNCNEHLSDDFKKLSRPTICSLHFTTQQFTSSLRTRLRRYGIPTIFPKISANDDNCVMASNDEHGPKTEDSLKRLNSLIKELEDVNAALNQGINIAEEDFGSHCHIKKEADETALLTFEDITAEDRSTNHDCKSRKNNKNLNIITYEEITSEDMMDVNGTLISKESEVLNSSFEEKYSSFDIDKEIKLEIVDDEEKCKSVQGKIYSFPGITSGDDYEFKSFNPILKREIEDDVKLEIDLINDSEIFEKIKNEILMWDEVHSGDYHKLSDNLDVKEVKCENVLPEADIKIEKISDSEETISTPISMRCDDTFRDIPCLTHQISKQNQFLTSEINLGSRSFSKKESQISKIGSYESSATSEISYNKNVYQTAQAATNCEAKSFERTKSDRFSLFNCSANDTKNNLANKVIKKNSYKGNACITTSSSKAMDPYKKCLEIPVDKKIISIKLKPYKRKKENISLRKSI